MRPSVLILLLCTLVASPASGSDFWERIQPPKPADESADGKSFDDLVAKAEEYTQIAEQYRALYAEAVNHNRKLQARDFEDKSRQAAKQAIRAIDQALELRPEDADLHYRCGHLSYAYLFEYYDKNGPTSLRDEAGGHAVEHWEEFERLAPDDPRRVAFIREAGTHWGPHGQLFLPSSYQFDRSLYYTKLGGDEAFEKALEDYDYLLDAAPRTNRTANWIALLLTNSAEIHMALGNLDEAIDRYREGLEYWKDPLYMFGLAVALDRAGEKLSSLEVMREALAHDPDMKNLAKSSVFFIPRGDIHYYFGLAFEAEGEDAKALLHYREYVDRVEDERYVEHAKQRIDRLTNKKETKRRK